MTPRAITVPGAAALLSVAEVVPVELPVRSAATDDVVAAPCPSEGLSCHVT
jgi:hypothetical protein